MNTSKFTTMIAVVSGYVDTNGGSGALSGGARTGTGSPGVVGPRRGSGIGAPRSSAMSAL